GAGICEVGRGRRAAGERPPSNRLRAAASYSQGERRSARSQHEGGGGVSTGGDERAPIESDFSFVTRGENAILQVGDFSALVRVAAWPLNMRRARKHSKVRD